MQPTEQSAEETKPAGENPSQARERRRAVRRLLRAEMFYAAILVAFAVLSLFAYRYTYFGWDLTAAHAVQSVRLPGLLRFMLGVSWFGNGWTPYWLTGAMLLLFLLRHRRSEAAGLFLSTGGSALLNTLLKLAIARPRPTADLVEILSHTTRASFPSGHVMFYVSYFGFLFFVAYALLARGSAWRRAALALMALPVALVGLSRVYLGAHWPSDTLGAYLVGGLWLALSVELYRRWKERATFKQTEGVREGTEGTRGTEGTTATGDGGQRNAPAAE